jgi:hemerythrin-like domain-containing protein
MMMGMKIAHSVLDAFGENAMGRKAADIIDMLTEDHDRLQVLFAAFDRLRENAADDARQTLVELACTEIVIHAQVKEEHLYPALAEVMDDTFILEQAEVEQAIIRRLVGELETMQAGDRLYNAKFTALASWIGRHIEDEQTRLFPQLDGLDLSFDALTCDIRTRRHELRSEFGMPDADNEDDSYRYHVVRRPHYRHH